MWFVVFFCFFFFKNMPHNHLEKLINSTPYQIMNDCETITTWKFFCCIYHNRLDVTLSFIFQVPK